MEIITRPINEVRPYEKNPRNNDAAVDAVAASIKEFGFKQPIVIDAAGIVIAGHTRLRAAKKLGLTKVPCIMADDLTEEQVKAYRLADNKTAELAEWDLDLLAEELDDILDIDMEDFGFEFEDEPEREVVEDNFEPVVPPDPKSKPGQIYKLGGHRLMVGDSTNELDVQKLAGGDEVDLFLTDPPYNVDYVGKTKDALKIENDSMDDSSFVEFLTDAFAAADSVMREGAAFYIWHADSEGYNFRKACRENGWKVRQCLIWNKNVMVMGRQDYQWKHEPCLYGWKEGAAHYFVEARNITTIIEDGLEFDKMKKEEMRHLLEDIFSEKVPASVINEKKPTRSELHPTMKPIKLMARQVENSSKPGQIVLDLFGGSGSTLMACEQLGRRCYTMELDPRYADVIIQRWEEFTGETAELVTD